MTAPNSPEEKALVKHCQEVERQQLIAGLLKNGHCPDVIMLPTQQQQNSLKPITPPETKQTKDIAKDIKKDKKPNSRKR